MSRSAWQAYCPIDLLMISFMTSLVPPYILVTRASARSRAIGYSVM